MLNIGGGEVLVIFLVALVVLGPTKLPEAARTAGKVMSEFKKISSGFQREFREA
ncbi:MAG: Sec-independent protein translocase protein TatB, partial [Acidimicrobiales bacterium]